MDMKKAFTHLVKAGRDAMHIESTLENIGYRSTPYFNLYSDICDALYAMLGEDTELFEQSETYAAIHDIYTPDEIVADGLVKLWDSAVGARMGIPDTTRMMIEESARERGVETASMVKLILSEWATKQLFLKNVLK